MKILVTGFDPFGGELVNPAIETVKRLRDNISGAEIIKLEIPTVCHKSLRVIEEAVVKYDPDVVLSIGQAGGRPDITIERVGINVDDCRIPDNEGNQIIDEPVYPDGPAGSADSEQRNSRIHIQYGGYLCLQPCDIRGLSYAGSQISWKAQWFYPYSIPAPAGNR